LGKCLGEIAASPLECTGALFALGGDLEAGGAPVVGVSAPSKEGHSLELGNEAGAGRGGGAPRPAPSAGPYCRKVANRAERRDGVEGEGSRSDAEGLLEPVMDGESECSKQVGRTLLQRGDVKIFPLQSPQQAHSPPSPRIENLSVSGMHISRPNYVHPGHTKIFFGEAPP